MVKINHISKRDYQKILLQKGKKLFSSNRSEFYQVDDNILKDYQYEKISSNSEFLLCLLQNWKEVLIEQSKIIGFDELIKPKELWIIDGLLKGITMPKLSSDVIDFEDYINSCRNNMEVICKIFVSLNAIFERGSKLNLVFLDTITKGNLKINPTTTSISRCDGEGIQTNKTFPFTASTLLNLETNDAILHKYLVRTNAADIYAKTNLNRLAILTYFIKLCTKYVCITDLYPGMKPDAACEMVLDGIGLGKDNILAPIIRNIYTEKEIPGIETERWNGFGHAYQLIPMNYDVENYSGYAFRRR